MFDKKQKSCVKRIYLVTDHGLFDRKAFYKVKIHPQLTMNIYTHNIIQYDLVITLKTDIADCCYHYFQ